MRSRYIYAPDGRLVAQYKGSDCVFFDSNYYDAQDSGLHVIPDIQPYKSMIDGSVITSRSVHRAHLKQHGCVEVGNDSSLRAKPKPIAPPPGLKETIIRAVNEKLRRV